MKSLVRRIVKLEQHAETVQIDLPPLPPPDASEEELVRAAAEAWRQLQAHPHQRAWFLRMIEIAQRHGITSTKGAEEFQSVQRTLDIPPSETSDGPARRGEPPAK